MGHEFLSRGGFTLSSRWQDECYRPVTSSPHRPTSASAGMSTHTVTAYRKTQYTLITGVGIGGVHVHTWLATAVTSWAWSIRGTQTVPLKPPAQVATWCPGWVGCSCSWFGCAFACLGGARHLSLFPCSISGHKYECQRCLSGVWESYGTVWAGFDREFASLTSRSHSDGTTLWKQ